jgi:xanthine dehydrogenase YagT iron-sulfur-binding subunit
LLPRKSAGRREKISTNGTVCHAFCSALKQFVYENSRFIIYNSESPVSKINEFIEQSKITRRNFVVVTVGGAASLASAAENRDNAPLPSVPLRLTVNGQSHNVAVDSRTTLLDLLRENLHLTGTKKGCDHGQCGACTVLVNGKRINSCLSLAVMNEGFEVTTIEGFAAGAELHPMQAAFVEHDALQCGYCTPGQICSAIAMLNEAKNGAPSAITPNLSHSAEIDLSDEEIRERMSGNICRCGAYPGIVAAIKSVKQGISS